MEYSEREEPSSRREVKHGLKRTLSEVLDDHKENFDQVDAFELSVDTPNNKSRKRKRVSFAGEGQMMHEGEEREQKRQKLQHVLDNMEARMQSKETDSEMLAMVAMMKQEINSIMSTPEKRPPSATKYATTSKLKTSSSRTDHTKGRTVASKELFKSPAKPDTVFKTPEKPAARPRSNPSSTKKTPSKPEAIDLDKTNESTSIDNSVDEQPQVHEFEDELAIESAQRAPSKTIASTPPVDKPEPRKSAKEIKTPKKTEKVPEEKTKEKTPAKPAKPSKAEEQTESKSKEKTQKPVEKSKPEESKRRDSLRSSQERKQNDTDAEDKTSKKKGESVKKDKAKEEPKGKDKKDKTRQSNSNQAESVVLILDHDEAKKPAKDSPRPAAQKKNKAADDDEATQIVDSGKNDKKSKRGSAKSTKSQESAENDDKTPRGKRKRESSEDSDEEKTPPKKARKEDDKKEGLEKSSSFSVVRSGKKHQSILFTRNAERVGTVVIEDSQSSQAQADSQRRSGRINKSKWSVCHCTYFVY